MNLLKPYFRKPSDKEQSIHLQNPPAPHPPPLPRAPARINSANQRTATPTLSQPQGSITENQPTRGQCAKIQPIREEKHYDYENYHNNSSN